MKSILSLAAALLAVCLFSAPADACPPQQVQFQAVQQFVAAPQLIIQPYAVPQAVVVQPQFQAIVVPQAVVQQHVVQQRVIQRQRVQIQRPQVIRQRFVQVIR